jgi:hypothetical protein
MPRGSLSRGSPLTERVKTMKYNRWLNKNADSGHSLRIRLIRADSPYPPEDYYTQAELTEGLDLLESIDLPDAITVECLLEE